MRLRWAGAALMTLGAVCVGACSPSLTVRAGVRRPARVPLRVFPRILVVTSGSPEAERLGRRLVAHLEPGRSAVRHTSEARAERMLSEGTLRPGTAVVRVSVVLTEGERSVVARRQTLECGPLGCQNSRRNRIEAVPVLTGHAVLTVFDGPSGRSLQRETVRAEEVGHDVLGMRLRVFERLVQLTSALVDQRTEEVSIELVPIEPNEVHAALTAIHAGEWTRGRALLEAFSNSTSFDALSPEHRAIVLYDLGQAHRFDSSVPADVRFERADEALRAAILLDPQSRFARALDELGAHRLSRRLVREQREAAAHNFRLAREPEGDSVPRPPASYR